MHGSCLKLKFLFIMSWQAYIDSSLIGTGFVAQAAIHGLDGNPWAFSPGFNVTPAEAQKLIQGFASAEGLYSGFHLGGEKFMFLRGTDAEIHGKKGGEEGVTITKSGTAIIIATYNISKGPTQTAGNCSKTASKLAEYLISVNY